MSHDMKKGLALLLALSLTMAGAVSTAAESPETEAGQGSDKMLLQVGENGTAGTHGNAMIPMEDAEALSGDAWLPIGTVVLLNGGTKTLMIIGRIVQNASDTKIYEYCGCLYPEGYAGSQMYFFNQDDISIIASRGYENEYELLYREETLAGIDVDQLTVKDGQIVPIDAAEKTENGPELLPESEKETEEAQSQN